MIDCFLRFVGTVLFCCCDHGNDIDLLQPNKRETQNRPYYYQYNNSDNETDRFQTNRKTNQNKSQVYQYEVESYRRRLGLELNSDSCSSASGTVTYANSCGSFESPARSNTTPNYLLTKSVSPPPTLRNASLSNNLVGKPGAFSSNLFLDWSNDINNHPLSKIESNAPASSHPKISIQSSPSSPDAVCLPYKIKPATSPSMQGVPKSNMSKDSPASKPILAASPRPKVASSLTNSTKQTNTSHVVQPDAKVSSSKTSASLKTEPGPTRIKDSEEAGKGSTSTSSLPTKSMQSSPTKPANASSMQWVVKSNNSKKFPASHPIPTASSTPKTVSSLIYPTKQTNTFPFLQSDAGWHSSSKVGPDQSEFEDSKSNASTNYPASPEGGPGPDGKDLKEVGKDGTHRYEIPKHIEEMIKKDIVPSVLQIPLSPDTYADYFAALLYAEDFYCEKWSNYLLENVTLKLRTKENSGLQDQFDKKKNKKDSNSKTQEKNYPYVVFKITDVPERRPFLLSRDHVHLKPLDKSKDKEPFHGVLFRVEKSTTILAEFDVDFHRQHEPSKKYDVSFSFNRVCLKRAHHAVSAATNPHLCQILFPKITLLPSQQSQVSLTDRILNHKLIPIPYLIEGPFDKNNPHQIPNRTMNLVKDIVLHIYESCNENRVLICSPKNSTCDELMRVIMKNVNTIDLFRANAAFREKELVPGDVMPACLFGGECFTCPPLPRLKKFRIITSTFISTFRLYNKGLKAGHFSHIFLVDATFAIEPEVIVALADLVSEETVVVVTGFAGHKPRWVRSDFGRRHGLSKSFFERLLESEPYQSGNLQFITRINQL